MKGDRVPFTHERAGAWLMFNPVTAIVKRLRRREVRRELKRQDREEKQDE